MFPTESKNWFKIENKNSGKEYSYEDFIKCVEKQIDQTIQKVDKHCFNSKYFLNDVKIVLEKHKYEEFTSISKNANSNFCCMLTFHSTQNISKINSICKYGYLIPGMQHPTFGWSLYMATGNLYGDGVYSSPEFETSKWYGFLDCDKGVQLVVNIVFLGRTKTVYPYNYCDEDYFDENKDSVTSIPSHNGDFYCDSLGEYDTLMSDNMSIIVSGDVRYIIPVAIISMSPNAGDGKMKEYIYTPKNKLVGLNEMYGYDYYCGFNTSTMINIFGNYNILDISNSFDYAKSTKKILQFKHIICIPTKLVTLPVFANFNNTICDFVNSLDKNSKKVGFVYGTKTLHKTINNNFKEFIDSIKYDDKENINNCLVDVFETILKENTEYVNIIYLFVFSPDDHKHLQKVYEYKVFKKLVIKIIFLKNVVKELCHLKSQYQNVNFFENYYHQTNVQLVGETCDVLLDELTNIPNYNSTLVQVAYPLGIVGEGFVNALEYQPTWDYNTTSNYMLFKGYVSSIKTSPYNYCKVEFLDKTKKDENKETFYVKLYDQYHSCTNEIKELEDKKLDLETRLANIENKVENPTFDNTQKKYAEVTFELQNKKTLLEKIELSMSDYDDIAKLHEILIPLVAKFRNYVFVRPERCKTHCKHIVELCEKLIEKTNNYPKQDDVERNFFEQMYPSIGLRKTVRFQLQKLLSDITAFSKVKFSGKWLDKLVQMKFGKKITKRTHLEFDIKNIQQLLCLPNKTKFTDISDAFGYVDRRGLLIRTRQTGASEVEPWNIVVEYVSNDYSDLKTIFIENEKGATVKDSKARVVNNLLLDFDKPTYNDDIYKMYHAYVFTRVPQLYITSQPTSLLVNVWISSLEQLFKVLFMKKVKNEPYDKDKMLEKMKLSIELFERVKMRVNDNAELIELRDNILNSNLTDNPVEKYLTTKNNVVSLTKVLACLALSSDKLNDANTYNSESWHRFCFSLLAECSIRSAITKTKSTKCTSEQSIFEVLGLEQHQDVSNWKVSKDIILQTIQKTNRFFLKQYTNCSLFTVVSVLGFLQHYYLAVDDLTGPAQQILEAFTNEKISTKTFLTEHMPNSKGRMTQLALYLYGMKYSTYTKPENVYFDNPRQIVNDICMEHINIIMSRQSVLAKASVKVQQKLLKRLQIAEPYKAYHGAPPKIFNHAEIDELNKTRAKDDKLELMNNGLLLSHCCFENCPMFLQKLTISNDPKYIASRRAIINHLQYDPLLNNYVKNFHENAKNISKRAHSYENFESAMNVLYRNDIAYFNLANRELHLRNVWDNYKK